MNDLQKQATLAQGLASDLEDARAQLEPTLIERAKQVIAQRRAIWTEMFPGKKLSPFHRNRYLSYTDFFELSEDCCSLECWERGRCGDPDDILHSLSVKQLTDDNFLEADALKFRAESEKEREVATRAEQAERDDRIAQLKAELTKLEAQS